MVGLSHLGDLMFHQKTAGDVIHEAGTLSWWSCQSSVAHSFCLLSHLNTFHRGMFKHNAKFDSSSLLYLVILNVTATQDTCSLNWCLLRPLTSTVKSSLFTHVHSSPLSLGARLHPCCANHSRCINNGWTFYGHPSYSCWISVIRIFFSFHYLVILAL